VQELKLRSPKSRSGSWSSDPEGHASTDCVFRVKVLSGESEGREFETPEARIAEVACGRRSVGGTCQWIVNSG
jgi:hypothetical protein